MNQSYPMEGAPVMVQVTAMPLMSFNSTSLPELSESYTLPYFLFFSFFPLTCLIISLYVTLDPFWFTSSLSS